MFSSKLNSITSAMRLAVLVPATFACLSVSADEAGEIDTTNIERIMVTGQKIARTVQETTTSVAVLTEKQLEQENINDFREVLINTANTHTSENRSFSIRGIDGFNVSGGGNSFLASVYVDGAPLPERMIYGGGFSTWDAKQIEVLRGPQSTLQGRNALAGAVIMTTQAPTQEWEGKYQLTAGQNGQQEIGVAIGGGLIEDELAFRFSGEKKEIDGYNENLTRNETADFHDDETYRLKFLYQPLALPEFSAQLGYTYANSTYGNTAIEIAAGEDPFSNRHSFNNDERNETINANMLVLELNYDLSDIWSLGSYTSWSAVDTDYKWDSDFLAIAGSVFPEDTGSSTYYKNTTDSLSQELRLTFEYDNLSGVIGGYFFKTEIDDNTNGLSNLKLNRLGLTSDVLQARYGLSEPIADLVVAQYAEFNPAHTSQLSSSQQTISSYALFADGVWNVTDKWDIFAGIRFDHESQETQNDAKYVILNKDKMPDPANYIGTPYEAISPLIAGINKMFTDLASNASQMTPQIDTDFNTVLPKIGVSYNWSEDLITSVSFQKGYRSGGVGINGARAEVFEYDPEFTYNYEFSLRSTWLNGDLVANANLFYVDWRDQQVAVQLSPNRYDTKTVNAGQSSVKGFELELNYQLNDELALYASFGQAKSEFIDFVISIPTETGAIVNDLSGRQFTAPEWTGNVGATYTADSGIFANLNANYASGAPNRVNPYRNGLKEGDAEFDLQNDSRTLVNMQLGYEWQDIGLYLQGKNLFDEEYITTNFTRTPSLGAPRQVALTLRGQFSL
ncbi:TonB-dependent receptor [Shewanella gelidimarina]|uniref:TonB-dependent receptor n=1 Tax=Shewanella gelidimarina TaxID=56813 RepID=UPI00200D68A2|nr:TonB-dependent receptor [Shewanella gelidimarina]MCL1058584.1 TonB-dependent receptor [Shewanella gelidimarina]